MAWKKRQVPRVLLLVETSGHVGRAMIKGIARYAMDRGPWSIQFEHRALDSSTPSWLKEWRGDGIISRTADIGSAKLLQATGVPVVELYGLPDFGMPQVSVDRTMAARMIVDHFVDCGLRHFAHFGYEETQATIPLQNALDRSLAGRGFKCNYFRAPAAKHVLPQWHEQMRPHLLKWLRSLPRPIGVLGHGDVHALRLLDACRDLKIAVPEEMAILGIGNDPVICEAVHPTLSSIDVNAAHIGYEAARLLDRLMAGKKAPSSTAIPPSHIAARESTDIFIIDNAEISQAARFIREFGCQRNLDVSRVAEEIGVSRSFLERGFRTYFGRSPKAEIMRIRIGSAKMLLGKSRRNIESIARTCGFTSVQYFTRAFRREVGMTPYVYRQEQGSTSEQDEATAY
jgi:LacI family transcriptional regulator